MRPPARRSAALATLAVALLAPSAASAHTAPYGAPKGEKALRAFETRVLGAEHAAEHAAARRLVKASSKRPFRRPSQSRSGPASQVGRWTTSPFRIPTFAIHAALLHNGDVIFWGYPPATSNPRPNVGQSYLWSPRKGTTRRAMRSIPAPKIDADGDGHTEATPLYCSGESMLPDGRILLVGGNGRWPTADTGDDFLGLNIAYTFDPRTKRWELQGAMRQGRWYPSQVLMPDGRTVVLGGYNELEPGGLFNTDLEIFGGGVFTHEFQGDRRTALYPHMVVMPSGKVLLAGPARGDSGLLDPQTWTWSKVPALTRSRVGGNMVTVPGSPAGGSTRVLNIGGYDPDEANAKDDVKATASIEAIETASANPKWQQQRHGLKIARSYANAVSLPDGNAVVIGGGAGKIGTKINYAVRADHRNRRVELLNLRTGKTRLGPYEVEDRAYHSTAVLLPDGRIWSAGDDANPNNLTDTAEIYSPPYLFRGARPRVIGAPKTLRLGQRFTLRTPRTRGASRAVLMAPQAITHGAEMNARTVKLKKVGGAGHRIVLQLTGSAAIAPPQWYMLFALNDRGVPSKASWVRVTP
jgi:hypothetical protein